MLHYVKKLGKKNYWHELRSVRVIAPITMTVIFLERWEGVAIENGFCTLIFHNFVFLKNPYYE